ncbi:MAG: hypothetical protein WAP35_05220 [Solirubrobacterales bacterium]
MTVIALPLVPTQPAFAAQTATTESIQSVAETDSLERFIDIVPGSAVQPGTSTPVATGLDLSFAVDLGRVPDARTFTDAFRITNTDVVAHTIRVLPVGVGLGAISSVVFTDDSNPGDGPNTETIMPGTTEILEIATTTSYAGLQNGALRFTQVGDDRYFRRDLQVQTRQAPGAPTGLAAVAIASPAGIALSWTAPASTGVAGYNVYRASSAGGPFTKINPSIVSGTSYNDTTSGGGTRWYFVRALTTGVTPELESANSNVASGGIPPTPTSVSVPAGGANPANYINFSSRTNVTVRVALPAATEAGDTVNLEVSDGTVTITVTAIAPVSGVQTVNLTGINTTAHADGPIALRSWLTRPGAIGATATGTATKDTVAVVSSSQVAATASNPANYINIATGISPGTATAAVGLPASSMTTDTVSTRFTMGASTVTGTAAGLAGAGTRTIAGLSTNGWAQGAVAVASRVQDVAGNDSGWIAGTAATRDTTGPVAPTAARITATLINPIDTINIASQAAAGVSVTTNGAGVSGVEARLTVAAVSVFGTQAGSGTVVASVNATALANAVAGGVQVAARQFDLAGNPSAWFVGTAARKDTVAPNSPNFSLITFQNNKKGQDSVSGANGALGALDEYRIFDYADGGSYPATGYDAANNSGRFNREKIAAETMPRTLGYDIRDSAWNPIARVCRSYAANGSGSAVACP